MTSIIDNLSAFISSGINSVVSEIQWLLLSNGAADLNDNLIFFGFEHGQALPTFVAKVTRSPRNGWIVKKEYEWLNELWGHIGEDAAYFLPKPLGLYHVNAQYALVISYINGDGLYYSTKKKLWHELTYTISIVKEVALSLRKLHEQMVVPIERDEFVQSEITRKVGIFIECYSPTDREIHALYELISQYSSHDAGYKTLIQGDFWHGNIIRSATHDSLIIVDWQYARWATDVSLDVYLFLLAGAVALVRGTDEERARAAAGVIEQWSANIIPVYLEAYGKASRFSLLPLKYGMILCCVDKAVRAVMDFGYNQDDDGIWRNLFTELVNLKEWALED